MGAEIAEPVCLPLWSSLRAGRRRQAHGLARIERPSPGTAWPLPRPGLNRDGTVAGALAPPAGVVAHARGCPWPPSQKPQDDQLACRADLGVRMVPISINLRKKRDERPDPGQDGA